MSFRTHRTRLIAFYSLCLPVLLWQSPAWLSSWNLNLAWLLATRQSANDIDLRLRDAEVRFRRAVRLQRDRPGAWIGLGRIALLRGNTGEAQAAFLRAVDLDRSQPLANIELAEIRRSEGRFDEAATHYRAAGDAYSLTRLGDALASRQPRDAQHLYEDAIALQPGIRLPHTQLGRLLRREGRLDEALIEFRRALDAQPAYGWSWYLVAVTCLENGRPKECLGWIRSTRDKFPRDQELTAALQRLEARARMTPTSAHLRRSN